ncbi:MAG: GldM family protein [Chitinophagales bacterium]
MSGPKARIKKGNIALFVVLLGIFAYLFNKQNIDNKLIDIGLLEKNVAAETTTEKEDGKTADFEAESKKVTKEKSSKETKEEKANKAHIATKADVFFLDEDNPIQVTVEGVASKDISVLMGRSKNIEVETVDKNSGKYNIKTLRKGRAELSVMAKIDKKIDLIKTQKFEVVSRAAYAKKNTSKTSQKGSSLKLDYDLPNSNIMYVGIDNELLINPKNGNISDLQIKATNAKFAKSGEKFLVNPNNKGNVSVQVFDGSTKIEHRNFAARHLPMPLPAISGRSGGSISAAVLQRASRLDLITDYQDVPNASTPTIVSYEVMRYSPMSSSTGKAKNSGEIFSADVRRLVSQATVNDLLYFTNIKIKMLNGTNKELPSIAFDVK